MAGIDDWMAVAREATADDLRERILTGFKSGKPFTPYRPTLPLPAVRTVLDFGCGVGRSFPYLKEVASHVTGFDLPPMVERCRELAPVQADALSSDWRQLSDRRYDLIFTTLVLQHIEPDACRQYLTDFARMAPSVYLLTRASSDFGANVLRQCADSGLFDAGACVEVEHDGATHQLRVLGTSTFDEVVRGGRDGHYEVILRARDRPGALSA
jgi:SAM-dependent methyltransferase